MFSKIGLFLSAYKTLFLLGLILIIAAGSFSAGWAVNGWRKDSELNLLVARHESERANANALAFDELYKSAASIQNAATSYINLQDKVSTKIDLLRKDVKLYATKNPLPADCKPDDHRMQVLKSAIDTANESIAR